MLLLLLHFLNNSLVALLEALFAGFFSFEI